MRLARLGLSIVCGAAVTFGLFVVMSVLIASSDSTSTDNRIHKIADIWQSDRTIADQIKALTPEKPDAPVEPPPDLPDLKMDVAAPVGAVSMAAPNMDALKIGLGGSFARDSDYIPIYVPRPDYPPMARRRGISGYAVIEVTITETGGVRDPKLIEEYPENKGFGKYALRAAKKLKYKPRVVDGVAEEVPSVFYKFSFQMAN
ncbi:MAG TPA: energy transducer TonB [Porticoccus sp.]|nr:energy transducer TonB [Porticoccus sp.]